MDQNVFVSFDRANDVDLYQRMVEDSKAAGSGFQIAHHSEKRTSETELRRRIENADQVVVICGEHTDGAETVAAEVQLARELNRPYFLLWGRREAMCKRPTGSLRDDSMYTWTREVIREQLEAALRSSATRTSLAAQARPPSD